MKGSMKLYLALFLSGYLGTGRTQTAPFDVLAKPYNVFIADFYQELQRRPTSKTDHKFRLNLKSNPMESDQCAIDTSTIMEMASHGDKQALRFVDSIGKFSSGVLEGTASFPGLYSECLDSHVSRPSGSKIQSKYCFISAYVSDTFMNELIWPKASLNIVNHRDVKRGFGTCVPASCNSFSIRSVTQNVIDKHLNDSFVMGVSCNETLYFSKDAFAIFISILVLLLVTIVVSATAYDVFHSWLATRTSCNTSESFEILGEENYPTSEGSLLKNCFLCFSLTRAIPTLCHVSEASRADTISALHGIRFICTLLIMFDHNFTISQEMVIFKNPGRMQKLPQAWYVQIFANGTFSVDTFYFISGLLATLSTLKVMGRNYGKIPYFYFYVHRYMRLTPLLLVMILISAAFIRYSGMGPQWHYNILIYDDYCRDHGWLNMLYIQNLFHSRDMCLDHTWYLATDMQYFIVLPFILVPLYKKFRLGCAVIALLMLVNILATIAVTAEHKIPAVPYMNDQVPYYEMNIYWDKLYIKPWCRMSPYLIGILAGYMLATKKEFRMSKVRAVLLWMVVISVMLAILLGMTSAHQGNRPSVFVAALYSAFARPIWAVGLAWITLACYYGYGGIVNSMLSWKTIVPFSRLTYSAYLVHPVLMSAFYASFETAIGFKTMMMVCFYLGNVVISFFLALVLSAFVEVPFAGVEKAIIRRKIPSTMKIL